MKSPPYLPVSEVFPESRILRDNWKAIQAELQEILKEVESIPQFHEVDRLQRNISARGNVAWRALFLKWFDKWLPGNCARAPKTAALLRQLPMITTAMFSIIDGGKHIPPHVGFFKSVLRYHLALIVPADAPVYIVVGGRERTFCSTTRTSTGCGTRAWHAGRRWLEEGPIGPCSQERVPCAGIFP